MDHPEGTPDFYRDADASDAVERSHRSITAIEALDPSGLVRPIITPRFIPACTDAALEGLGELAEATGALVQTHCSESDWEHGYVLDRFGVTDTVALERFGLARDHSVLAHADHVTHSDQQVLAGLGAGIAHCPLSNSYFANAVLPVRQVLDNGVRLGLGTDVAGGPDASILASAGHAVTVSRMLEDGVDPVVAAHDRATPDSRIDVVTAFYLATVGGAEVLGLNAGLLEHGHVFDAFVVQTGTGRSVEVWPEVDDDGRIFEKVVRGARGTDVSTVWVNGQTVVDAD
jgi:guanine deaminase